MSLTHILQLVEMLFLPLDEVCWDCDQQAAFQLQTPSAWLVRQDCQLLNRRKPHAGSYLAILLTSGVQHDRPIPKKLLNLSLHCKGLLVLGASQQHEHDVSHFSKLTPMRSPSSYTKRMFSSSSAFRRRCTGAPNMSMFGYMPTTAVIQWFV